MKIALVILHADPTRGGAERYTLDLARALRRRGNEVTLLASSFADGLLTSNDVLLPARAPTRLGRYLRFLDTLDEHFAASRYDIVHAMLPVRRCDVYHPHAGIAIEAVQTGHLKHASPASQFLARAANRINLKRQRFAAIEKQLLTGPHPPVVLCLSEYIKRTVLRHYSLDEAHLATLFNATDLDKFNPAARPDAGAEIRRRFDIAPGAVVALMIAQDFERKGLREAILAIAQAQQDRLTLLVVGKQDPEPYKRLAEREGVAGQMRFAGATDDPYPFYRAADFFVLPTRHDPCSLVVLEALSMGLPVISTASNGACEIMTNGVHGFVLPDPSDVAALSDALRAMLDDVRRQQMSNACLYLRPQLSYERHLDRLLEIYRSAARA